MDHRLRLLLFTLLFGGAGALAGPVPSLGVALGPSPARAASVGDLPPSRARGAQPADAYAEALSALLARVVTENGRVRYDRLRGDLNADFRRVLRAVEEYDASTLGSQEEKLAFWINAYNVQMLANVLEAWPVRDVSAHAATFFRRPLRTAGIALTLDQIEHVILRRQPGPARAERLRVQRLDPRLHAAVNCAARSCPRLGRRAYVPATVDTQLDAAMRAFTARPEHFRRTGDGFVLSAIVEWYGADFEQAGRSPAGDYLLLFMPAGRPGYAALRRLLQGRSAAELSRRPDVSFSYDWTLNATAASLPKRSTS